MPVEPRPAAARRHPKRRAAATHLLAGLLGAGATLLDLPPDVHLLGVQLLSKLFGL